MGGEESTTFAGEEKTFPVSSPEETAGAGIRSSSSNTVSSNRRSVSGNRFCRSPLSFSELLSRRNFSAAASLLQRKGAHGAPNFSLPKADLWLAYCYYHSGAYEKALQIYEQLFRASCGGPSHVARQPWGPMGTDSGPPLEESSASSRGPPETPSISHCLSNDATSAESTLKEMTGEEIEELPLLMALCHFRLGQPEKGLKEIKKAPPSPRKRRLLLFLRMQQQQEQQKRPQQQHREDAWLNIDKEIQALGGGSTEDILCAAAAHFLRRRYEKAAELYENLLSVHPEAFAVKVYWAVCCYKMGEIEKAQTLVEVRT